MGYTGDQKREYQVQWLRKRRLKAIELLGGQCVVCKATEALEFDHIDPANKDLYLKGGAGGKFFSRSWSWIEEELAKCQLLCVDCHKKKTLGMYPERIHGTSAMRYGGKCKCSDCREFGRAQKAEWRAKAGRN